HLILNAVNQLGRHSLNMEALMGKDLDQLTEVITGALQEADEERLTDGAKPGPGAAPLQKIVGLESVHSITKQGQVPAPYHSEEKIVTNPAKDRSTLRLLTGAEGPDARVDSEIQRWMQGDQPPVGDVQPEEAQKNDIKIKTQLVHVGVKEFSSRGKDRHFGYIITNSE
ncbi:hypothetical protein GOODEAATRI_000386, partial [Goodea atripinnis]